MNNGDRAAFNCNNEYDPDDRLVYTNYGLTKRELFAAMAMQGLNSNSKLFDMMAEEDEPDPAGTIVEMALKSADKLLTALEKSCPEE